MARALRCRAASRWRSSPAWVSPRAFHSRAIGLADLIWAGRGEQADVSLRQELARLRRALGEDALPSGATLWSAALSGKPVRPGQAPDGGLLLPLEKSKPGAGSAEDPPEFAVEIVYLTPGSAWNDKGKARIALPALDLPVSRTGLQVYYPPLFRLSSEPGIFQPEAYSDPFSRVLSGDEESGKAIFLSGQGVGAGSGSLSGGGTGPGVGAEFAAAPPPPPPSGLPISGRDVYPQTVSPDTTKTLVDKYRSSTAVGRATGVLPLSVTFPAFGPSVYLVSQLTSENQSPAAEFTYQKDKKGGAR